MSMVTVSLTVTMCRTDGMGNTAFDGHKKVLLPLTCKQECTISGTNRTNALVHEKD